MDARPPDIRRGIDFANRAWSGGLAASLQRKFAWWRGGKFSQLTFIFLCFIFLLNLLLVSPIFTRDVSPSFSSAFLLAVSNFFAVIGIKKHIFFSVITILALLFSPVAIYLFARKMALRHELIAFLSSLFFILPSPLSGGKLSLPSAVLSGDGAHVVAFSIMPLFLLYAQAFVSTGASVWGVMSAVGIAIMAIVSPFSFFNFLIMLLIITISDGFMGNLRIKLLRYGFLGLVTIGLTLFWYVPSVLREITVMSHVRFAFSQFLSVAPLLIPAIPVAGSLAFLLFDRREKLRPVFIGISLFIVYLAIYSVSKSFQNTGILNAQRYMLELSLSGAFLFSIVFVTTSELFIRSILIRFTKAAHHFLFIIIVSGIVAFLGFLTISQIQETHAEIATGIINDQYAIGIGSMKHRVSYLDLTTIIASIISIGTFWFLINSLRKYPAEILRRKGQKQAVKPI